MDIGLSSDMFESFQKYQRLLRIMFHKMEGEYGFININAAKTSRNVHKDICQKVEEYIVHQKV